MEYNTRTLYKNDENWMRVTYDPYRKVYNVTTFYKAFVNSNHYNLSWDELNDLLKRAGYDV